MEKGHIKIIAENRKARHEYHIDDQYEAGLVLTGTEVKSLRLGKANLKDSYAKIKDGEVFLYQMHISAYPFAYYDNHEPLRVRKLLLHKREIRKLYGKVNEQGHTLVPLQALFQGRQGQDHAGARQGQAQIRQTRDHPPPRADPRRWTGSASSGRRALLAVAAMPAQQVLTNRPSQPIVVSTVFFHIPFPRLAAHHRCSLLSAPSLEP